MKVELPAAGLCVQYFKWNCTKWCKRAQKCRRLNVKYAEEETRLQHAINGSGKEWTWIVWVEFSRCSPTLHSSTLV